MFYIFLSICNCKPGYLHTDDSLDPFSISTEISNQKKGKTLKPGFDTEFDRDNQP